MQIEAKCRTCKTVLDIDVLEATVGLPIAIEVPFCQECLKFYRDTIDKLKGELRNQNELIAVLNDNIDYLSDYRDEEG